jgi:hypothetical protein
MPCTSQNAGKLLMACPLPSGLNDPAGMALAAVMVVLAIVKPDNASQFAAKAGIPHKAAIERAAGAKNGVKRRSMA